MTLEISSYLQSRLIINNRQFNASWTIDGLTKDLSLFDMIRNTHKKTPDYTVSAYSDNAAVMQGEIGSYWAPDYTSGSWRLNREVVHILAKVETHNHPTAISRKYMANALSLFLLSTWVLTHLFLAFPGAATGSGGEIRELALF